MTISNNTNYQSQFIIHYGNASTTVVSLAPSEQISLVTVFERISQKVPTYFRCIAQQEGRVIADRDQMEKNTYIALGTNRDGVKLYVHFESSEDPEVAVPTQLMIDKVGRSFREFIGNWNNFATQQRHAPTRHSARDLFELFKCRFEKQWIESGYMRPEQFKTAFLSYYNSPLLALDPNCICKSLDNRHSPNAAIISVTSSYLCRWRASLI